MWRVRNVRAKVPFPVLPAPFQPPPPGLLPYDIWRESLVRYIAYSSELGEACRPVIGDTFANATYGIAIAYVFADSIDKVFRGSELSHMGRH